MSKNVLITGANGGLGLLMTETLQKADHQVIACMRSPEGRNKQAAEKLTSFGAKIVEIDVTDENSVNQGITSALELAGNLDMVVNNAGFGSIGYQEAFTTDDIQKIFDVNVLGVHRVIRNLVPHFRENGRGSIVNVSSLLGRVTIPFCGPYNASKWALEAMTENYRAELSSFGIDVCLIEPGGFATGFLSGAGKGSDTARNSFYSDIPPEPEVYFSEFEQGLKQNPEQSPQLVADTLLEIINTPVPQRKFRHTVDKIGMGDPIAELNQAHEQLTQGLFSNMGLDHLLKPKS